MRLYARLGVNEVWLGTPYPWPGEVFVLNAEAHRLAGACSREDRFVSPSLAELKIGLKPVFGFPLEPGEQIDMVKEGRPPYTGGP